jgi:predicted metalloprotease
MRFNPKADIGGGRISDGGGGGGGGGLGGGGLGGGRLPIPGGFGIKGTIIIIVLYVILKACFNVGLPGPSLGQDDGTSGTPQSSGSDRYANCKTGDDANKSTDCARVLISESLENYWSSQFKSGQFKPASFKTFSGNTSTACGAASAGMGPFYCPNDQVIYEDTSFYKDVFENALGGTNADFVEAYVLAHEYGHHIQNLTGEMRNVRTQQGENSDAVKLELEADCYAGVWTKAATGTVDDKGVTLFESIDDADIQEAISAAKTVGDDSIQKKTQGSVNPDGWTHGSSEQRMQWFQTGYQGDGPNACQKIWG